MLKTIAYWAMPLILQMGSSSPINQCSFTDYHLLNSANGVLIAQDIFNGELVTFNSEGEEYRSGLLHAAMSSPFEDRYLSTEAGQLVNGSRVPYRGIFQIQSDGQLIVLDAALAKEKFNIHGSSLSLVQPRKSNTAFPEKIRFSSRIIPLSKRGTIGFDVRAKRERGEDKAYIAKKLSEQRSWEIIIHFDHETQDAHIVDYIVETKPDAVSYTHLTLPTIYSV